MMNLPSTPITKFARIDGETDSGMAGSGTSIPQRMPMFAASRTQFHSGNVANPKVDVKHFSPVTAGADWSKLVSINTPILVKNDPSVKFDPKSTIFGRNNIHASVPVDPLHFNHMIANEFVANVNKAAKAILKKFPTRHTVQFDECFDPNAVMHRLACEWKLAGINIVAAPPSQSPSTTQNATERCIAARIRGLQLSKNYWDSAIHGGFSCFFAVKFLVLKNIMRPVYKFSAGEDGKQMDEFYSKITSDHFYIPQIVAMYDIDSFLPLQDQTFSIHYEKELRVLTCLPLYMGMCFYNPQFKRREQDIQIKNIPIANGTVVDSRLPIVVQALMF